jgi:hypothetical protein
MTIIQDLHGLLLFHHLTFLFKHREPPLGQAAHHRMLQ